MFKKVIWFGQPTTAWVPPEDLWWALAPSERPSEKHVLAQIEPNGPHRWMVLA